MLTRKLVIVGLVLTGVGLALMGYLDPVVRVLFFGPTVVGAGAAFRSATGITGFAASTTRNFTSVAGRTAVGGTTSVLVVATIIAFAAALVGLLLTAAGVLTAGKVLPKGTGPTPAA